MVVISNLKQIFGQDLPYIQNKITELNTELNKLLLNPLKNEKKITYTRGKLLKYMSQEINLLNDPVLKQQKKNLLSFELAKHNQQLNNRIQINKKQTNGKISKEIGLKIKKTVSMYKQIPLSNNKKEVVTNTLKSVGSTISTVGSVAKIPAIGITKALKTGSKLTAKILTAPLHIHGYLFSKLINPSSPYKGAVVGKMSNSLEEILKSAMTKQEQMIRRI